MLLFRYGSHWLAYSLCNRHEGSPNMFSKIFTAAIAITIAALPIAEASARDFNNGPRHEAPHRYAPKPQQQRPQAHKPRPQVQPPHVQRPQAQRPHAQPPHVQKRKWARGQRFQDWRRYSEVRDYKRYGLKRPAANQRWVKVDNDYLLVTIASGRSEEHTSELQSRENLVCRLLLEKKKKKKVNQ